MSQIPGWVGVMTEAIPRLREVNIYLYQLVKIMNIAEYCNSLAYQMPGWSKAGGVNIAWPDLRRSLWGRKEDIHSWPHPSCGR